MTFARIALTSALLGGTFAATAAASAASYTFQCTCLSENNVGRAGCGPRGPVKMTFSVNTRTATVKQTGKSESFTYDAAYRGRGRNASYFRYKGNGRNVLIEKQVRTGGYALRTSGKGGYVQYELAGQDVYENVLYICRR